MHVSCTLYICMSIMFITYFSVKSLVNNDLFEEANTWRGVHLIQEYLRCIYNIIWHHHDITIAHITTGTNFIHNNIRLYVATYAHVHARTKFSGYNRHSSGASYTKTQNVCLLLPIPNLRGYHMHMILWSFATWDLKISSQNCGKMYMYLQTIVTLRYCLIRKWLPYAVTIVHRFWP